ncbi:MAG: cysteine hydrolase [Acidobacteria bacterium]|nr:cysteine hydrolase [Acidobacteriota bacterium]
MPEHKMVFVDVDTQADFMLPTGSLYVPGAEQIIPNLARLVEFARGHDVPVVSSADAHSLSDDEFQQFPPHCVKGTAGQKKLPETLLAKWTVLPNEQQPEPEAAEIARCRQWILEKQKFDLFTNIHAAFLFEKLDAGQYVVFGVATEYCVREAVLGLLQQGRPVTVVEDAIRAIEAGSGQAALQEMQNAGARLLRTQELLRETVPAAS